MIYVENGRRQVCGMSLGVRMSTPHGISQIPGASGRGTPVAPPAATHTPLRRPVGGRAVMRWLVSEGHRTQSALRVQLAVAHVSGLGWGVGRAHVVSNGPRFTRAAPPSPHPSKAAPMCLKLMLRIFELLFAR